MATSGSKQVVVRPNWLWLKFTWWQISQSVANNQTTIDWNLVLVSGNGALYYNSRAWAVTIDGQKYSGTVNINLAENSQQVVASGRTVITHKSDGTKTFSYSFSQTFNLTLNSGIWLSSYSGSGTETLTTIARASQPSCVTYPNNTQNVGSFGSTISIHMNRKSSAFTHTVRYAFGSLSGTCINAETGKAATDIGTGFKWKIPESFMDKIPNAVKGSGTIYVDTYNGTTKIGTKSCGFTATVPASVKPTCTIQVLDNTNIQETYGNLVKGLSKLYVKTNFYAAYSSPVKAYNVTANNTKYTAAEIVTGVLTKSGTTTITATVTDKRGRTSSQASASFTVLDYSQPMITALSVHRCDKDGTANDRGNYVNVVFSSAITPLNNKNTATYTLRYKKASSKSWTAIATDANGKSVTALNGNYSVANASFIMSADSNSPYDVEVSAADRHYTNPRQTSVSTAFTLMNFNPYGNSVAFGGVCEKENTLQNNLDFVQRGNQYCVTSWGANNYGVAGFLRMAEITITGTYANSPIVFEFVQRGKRTPMIVSVLFDSVDSNKPGLVSIWYEGTNYDAYLSETTDSVWGLYVKKSMNQDHITLSKWYTSVYMEERISVTFPGDHVDTVPLGLNGYYHATPAVIRSIIDCLLPVGMIIQLYSHADPNTMYPGTTWVRMANTFLWGCDSSGDIGTKGGEKTHTLTVAELPTHTHGAVYSGNVDATKTHAWLASGGSSMAYGAIETGGGAAHNNMPPYTQVSIWRRTA